MKIPKTPPNEKKLWEQVKKKPERFELIFGASSSPLFKGKYLHWDKLPFYSPPQGLSHEEWWFALKIRRRNLFKQLPLLDKKGEPFKYLEVDPIPERLHKIDQGAGGFIQMPDQITNPYTKDQYYVGSLIQEAITSSQLDGAATTRKVAKEMIRTGRPPRDRSEQMILNNFKTMQQIGKLKAKPLSKELVFEIHRMITDKTLKDSSETGRFRRANERIVVGDMYNEVFHDPPPAEQLEDRITAMCDFANSKSPAGFIHPAVRSMILHFWLAYDHPFVDGNGRTARALFYWSMLRHGFWLFEFISISQIILKAPIKYARAFLYTETDDNDLTYFILYHLEVIRRAIGHLHEYIRRRTERLQAIERELRGVATLNHRQRDLISHALRHPHHKYTIKSHQIRYFTPVSDLEEKLAELP